MAPAGTNPKIEELRFKVKTDPKSRLFYPLAEELRKVGQFAEAEQVLRTGLGTHGTYLSAWVVLGRVLREQQKHADAVEALTKALELDRGNVVAARLLAETYVALGEKVEAVKKYKLVHALLPGDEDIEATIHRLESELTPTPVVAVAEPEAEPDADPFDITYSGLKREQDIEIATGDTEPMSVMHSESPFEEPAADDGYSADAFAIERPAGMHVAESADVFEPDEQPEEQPEEKVAPGFIQGSFDANVPPPPPAQDDFSKTITMADLYANQGLIDEARDIYEDVLARDPDNEVVRRKLEALEDSSPPESREPAAESREPRIEKLESWLSKVKRSGVGSV